MTVKRLKISQKQVDDGAHYIVNGFEFTLTCDGYTIYSPRKQKLFQCLNYRVARQAFGHCVKV